MAKHRHGSHKHPSLLIESVILTCVHETHKRGIMSHGHPKSIVHADMDDKVCSWKARWLSCWTPLIQTNTDNVLVRWGNPVLYVCLSLRAALLFWKPLTARLHSWGIQKVHMTHVWPTKWLMAAIATSPYKWMISTKARAKVSWSFRLSPFSRMSLPGKLPLHCTWSLHEYLEMTHD